jgi:hypothetical protein
MSRLIDCNCERVSFGQRMVSASFEETAATADRDQALARTFGQIALAADHELSL